MELSFDMKQQLRSQSVIIGRTAEQPLSGLPDMLTELKAWCGTETDGVAVSYFFRQYALFITAQFDMISRFNMYCEAPHTNLSFNRVRKYGYPLLETHVDEAGFRSIGNEDRFVAFRYILTVQLDEFIQQFRNFTKVSPIICYENVLGSVLYFYATLEKRNPRRAAEDIDFLMDADNWKPIRTSYLAKLLGTASLQQAVTGPLRKTCCLYKELPDFDTCTFCPLAP